MKQIGSIAGIPAGGAELAAERGVVTKKPAAWRRFGVILSGKNPIVGRQMTARVSAVASTSADAE